MLLQTPEPLGLLPLPLPKPVQIAMKLFNKLPGFTRSAPGLEQSIWRRLPAILLWGTLLPLLLAGINR